ncbi:MAG: ATP-binding cassette domain-containing protein, partial [Propionibacteriales bacterium]|nr:ATP-binding cassette domain-containing protein [Propionibacteriales bacterium]
MRLAAATVRLDGVTVVDAAEVTVAAGEWVMLIGRNGAGKTSLLRAVAGLVPYDGSVAVDGREVATLG